MSEEHSPSLRDALTAAMDGADDAPETAVVETAAPAADGQARGADGKFAAPAEPDDYDDALGLDRETWQLTPAQVRERTKALAKEAREAGERASSYDPIEKILAPRRDALRANFGGEDRALDQLFHLSDWAGRDMAGFIRHMAQQSGFDLRTLMPQAAPDAGLEQPDLRTLIQQEARQQATAIAEERDNHRILSEFDGNTALEHRHNADIRRMMGGLLQAGAAADVTAAYHMALKAHPEISAKLAAQESAAAAKRDAEEAARRAKEKASAAASIRGSPGTASASATQAGHSSIRAALESAMQQESGRV